MILLCGCLKGEHGVLQHHCTVYMLHLFVFPGLNWCKRPSLDVRFFLFLRERASTQQVFLNFQVRKMQAKLLECTTYSVITPAHDSFSPFLMLERETNKRPQFSGSFAELCPRHEHRPRRAKTLLYARAPTKKAHKMSKDFFGSKQSLLLIRRFSFRRCFLTLFLPAVSDTYTVMIT